MQGFVLVLTGRLCINIDKLMLQAFGMLRIAASHIVVCFIDWQIYKKIRTS